MEEGGQQRTRDPWSTKKKDPAPRGVYRHPSGDWAIRFTCGAGHIHKLRVGRVKSEAIRERDERRIRAQREPGWCPAIETQRERERVQAEQAREKARVTFRNYAKGYGEWSKQNKRSWRTDEGRIKVLTGRFGDKRLDEITSLEIERFRDSLLTKKTKATANRYRDLLSGMFKRAIRDGHLAVNPVKTVSKFRENNERVTYLTADEDKAVHAALPPEYRPHFLVSIHTGLRWTEQMDLRWKDVDLLAGFITIPRSKHGRSRRVPINSTARSVLLDLGSSRQRPDDPAEPVFSQRPREAKVFFPAALQRAAAALKRADTDAPHLEDYTWHGNRHTFASRLAMAGVDLLTIKDVGGWRTLAMVQRYAHLAPNHLHAAVERLVQRPEAAVELARN
jgi:integrase